MSDTNVTLNPQPLHVWADVSPIAVASIGHVGPVDVGLPNPWTVDIGSLPTIHLAIDNIPKIQLGVDPVEIRLTQFPSIRGHLPADFSVGLSVLGRDLACIKLCGEAQIITEPYVPNPCEICAAEREPHAD